MGYPQIKPNYKITVAFRSVKDMKIKKAEKQLQIEGDWRQLTVMSDSELAILF